MDKKYIKRFIENCPLNNFTEDENAVERHKQFDDYLNKATEFININEAQLAQEFWEENFVKSQVLILQNSPFLRRCLVFLDVVVGCLNFITSKYINKRKATECAEMLSVQLKNSISLYKTIMTLAMNGHFHSVLSEYRTMYESFVITKYLLLHPELIHVYKEHSQFLALNINKIANNNTPEQDLKYNAFINKYGKDFAENLGWTKSVITNPKNRKLVTLANECQIESFFAPMYKVSCNYVHPSSLASTSIISPDFVQPFLNVCLYIIDYEIIDFLRECKVVKKDGILIRNLIDFLFTDIRNDFSKQSIF